MITLEFVNSRIIKKSSFPSYSFVTFQHRTRFAYSISLSLKIVLFPMVNFRIIKKSCFFSPNYINCKFSIFQLIYIYCFTYTKQMCCVHL